MCQCAYWESINFKIYFKISCNTVLLLIFFSTNILICTIIDFDNRLLVEKLPKHSTYKELTAEQRKQLKLVIIISSNINFLF